MYAIVDIAGQQFKVQKEQKLYVHRLDSEVGSQVDFNKVLLIDNEKSVIVGEPLIEGAMITAKVIEHLKGDKVIVFKKKRRKGYKVKNGHRQFFTMIEVQDIVEKGANPKPAMKSARPEVDKEKPVEDKVEATAEASVEPTVEATAEVTTEAAAEPTAEVKEETTVAPKVEKKKPVAEKTVAKGESGKSAEVKKPAKTKAKDQPAKKVTTKKDTTAAKTARPVAKKTGTAKKEKDQEK